MFDLIAPQEAADILGVSTERVRQFALRGALPPAVTTGGRRLYRREDVQALADRRRADAFWTGERGSWASRASLAVSTIGTRADRRGGRRGDAGAGRAGNEPHGWPGPARALSPVTVGAVGRGWLTAQTPHPRGLSKGCDLRAGCIVARQLMPAGGVRESSQVPGSTATRRGPPWLPYLHPRFTRCLSGGPLSTA